MPLFFTDYAGYMESLDRLAALKPQIGCMAHQGPLVHEEVGALFEQARHAATQLKDEIVEDTRDDDIIVQDLFNRYYRDELTMYTPANILACIRLLVRRAKEIATR